MLSCIYFQIAYQGLCIPDENYFTVRAGSRVILKYVWNGFRSWICTMMECCVFKASKKKFINRLICFEYAFWGGKYLQICVSRNVKGEQFIENIYISSPILQQWIGEAKLLWAKGNLWKLKVWRNSLRE